MTTAMPSKQVNSLDSTAAIQPVKEPLPATEKPVWQVEESPPAKPPYSALPPVRRRVILAIITVSGLLGPLAGNIYLPALPLFEGVFDTSATAINATVTSFMFIFAIAPLVWTSFADVSGRRPLYLLSLAIFVVANILLAAVPANFGALIFLRIMQACGSAAVVSMGAGTVGDIIEPRSRGKGMSYFLLGPQLGPVIGPVLGGALAGEASWRWIFGFLALLGFGVWLSILFMLPETLRCRVGNCEPYSGVWILLPPRITSKLVTEARRGPAPAKPTLKVYWELFTYPPIGIVSFNTAILYSTYFCIAVQLPTILSDDYFWSLPAIGASYLAIGVAMILGSILGGHANDWRRAKLLAISDDNKVDPESRLVDQIWGVITCALGTVMFGWFANHTIHPAGLLIATFLSFGMSWVFVATTAFLSECVPQQAAGAFALGNMLRSPAAGVAALITPSLISRMGIGWFFSGLCILDLVVVGGAVIFLNIRGPHWRAQRSVATKPLTKPLIK